MLSVERRPPRDVHAVRTSGTVGGNVEIRYFSITTHKTLHVLFFPPPPHNEWYCGRLCRNQYPVITTHRELLIPYPLPRMSGTVDLSYVLSDNDVDLSDNDVGLSNLHVDFSDLHVDLSDNFFVICI